MDPIECASRTTIDCPSAGKLMASIMELSAINVPYRQVFNFYNRSSCLEPDYDVSHVVGLYDAWANTAEGDQVGTLYDVITEDSGCFFDYCKNLNFTGNADFAGVGVVVAFCVQISIATCFAILYLYLFFKRSDDEWRPFRATFHTFFMSSVFFNAAIGIAATSTIIMENKSQYTALFAPLGFLLSLASTQTMWALYRLLINPPKQSDDSTSMKTILKSLAEEKVFSESRLLKLCLALLWITLLAICGFIIKVEWGTNFELFCFDNLRGQALATNLLYTPLGLVSLGLICAVLKKIFPEGERFQCWMWLGPITAFFGLIIMWLAFVSLWYLRTELRSIGVKGYQDNHWGFGQIAAVAALLPTLVDIIRDSHKLLVGEEQQKDGGEGKKEEVRTPVQSEAQGQVGAADCRV
ncbi:hypothetical protein B0T11DRAFT_287126 [Plectosphaerella cucumerina]|uniref:Uncharacterized protein n=1 Tax=Plectosphaerella cucumerina TaxID=40658 RepID=A0A8K0TDT6_9PEZI|nr:hypothetical protein B0T11DRAFT_287126 [Plectosphaerella cucumerina]